MRGDEDDRIVERLRRLGDEPLPTEVRDRHLLRIRTHDPEEAAVRRSPARWRRGWARRLAPLTAAATGIVLLSGGGTVVAAQDATPDDTLYAVKRASEEVWKVWPRGSDRAADVQLTLASRRLEEARRAPVHAATLVSEGADHAEAAADDRPEDAIAAFGRLLGDGEDRLPPQASPMARIALHRNCTRIAERHGLSAEPCGAAPAAGDHPGRGWGPGGPPWAGDDEDGDGGPPWAEDGEHPGRGWGPEGRPEGAEGPPWRKDGGEHPGRGGGPPGGDA
jgi:hypothetical protein